jgi:hypothetical protein
MASPGRDGYLRPVVRRGGADVPVAFPAHWRAVRAGDAEYTRRLLAACPHAVQVISAVRAISRRAVAAGRVAIWVPGDVAERVARDLERDRAHSAALAAERTARRALRAWYLSTPREHRRGLHAALAETFARPVRAAGSRPRRAREPEDLRARADVAARGYAARAVRTSDPLPGQLLPPPEPRPLLDSELDELLSRWGAPRAGRRQPAPRNAATPAAAAQARCQAHCRYPDLDLAAVARRREGHDRAIVLWYTLRNGSGRADVAQIRDAARALGLTRRTLQRVVAAGTGMWWRRGRGGTLYLQSPARAAAALGARLRWRVLGDGEVLRGCLAGGRLARTRAWLAETAVHAIRGNRPTSLATIQDATASARRTVQRRRRSAGLPVERTWRVVRVLAPGEDMPLPDRAHLLRAARGGATVLVRQGPSAYTSPPPRRRAARETRTTLRARAAAISGYPTAHGDPAASAAPAHLALALVSLYRAGGFTGVKNVAPVAAVGGAKNVAPSAAAGGAKNDARDAARYERYVCTSCGSIEPAPHVIHSAWDTTCITCGGHMERFP